MDYKDCTLLIVDDEENLLEILANMLTGVAGKIITAVNGREGLEMLNSHEIHCVLSDIKMPVMDGINFIKNVRESGNDVPFIFFTAYGSEDLMIKALKYGAFDFVDKPNFENIEGIVKNALDKVIGTEAENSKEDEITEYKKMLEEKKKKDL